VFSLGGCRIASFLLLHSRQAVTQKLVCEETRLSKGFVSRVVSGLVREGIVKRPFKNRFSLEYPERLLVGWVGNRRVGELKTFFCGDERVLEELKRRRVKHAHTLLSGAWIDANYLRSGFKTVYVEPGFDARKELNGFEFVEGELRELKKRVALVVADDEFVFYGVREFASESVVNPFLLYVDLASFGGIALTALDSVAEKHGLPKLQAAPRSKPTQASERAQQNEKMLKKRLKR